MLKSQVTLTWRDTVRKTINPLSHSLIITNLPTTRKTFNSPSTESIDHKTMELSNRDVASRRQRQRLKLLPDQEHEARTIHPIALLAI